jgi:hypothetical protein
MRESTCSIGQPQYFLCATSPHCLSSCATTYIVVSNVLNFHFLSILTGYLNYTEKCQLNKSAVWKKVRGALEKVTLVFKKRKTFSLMSFLNNF